MCKSIYIYFCLKLNNFFVYNDKLNMLWNSYSLVVSIKKKIETLQSKIDIANMCVMGNGF